MFKKSFEIAIDSYKIIFKNAIHLLLPFIIPCFALLVMNYVTDFYAQPAIIHNFSSLTYGLIIALFTIIKIFIYVVMYFVVLFETRCLVKILNNKQYSAKEELLLIKSNWLYFLKLITVVLIAGNIIASVFANIIMFMRPLTFMPFLNYAREGINEILYWDILQKSLGGFIYSGVSFVLNIFVMFFAVVLALKVNNDVKKVNKQDFLEFLSKENIAFMLLSVLFAKTPKILLYFIPYSVGSVIDAYILPILFVSVIPCCIFVCLINKINKDNEDKLLGEKLAKDLI